MKAFGAGSSSSASAGVAMSDQVEASHRHQRGAVVTYAPTRRVTLGIPRFQLPPRPEIAHDFRDTLLSATLVMLDASTLRPGVQQSLGAMLASVDASLYVVVDADGPFVAGDVPGLLREVRSGAALVARSVVWRACRPVGSGLLRSRHRLAQWVFERILRDRRCDVLSGLFVIERFRPVVKRQW